MRVVESSIEGASAANHPISICYALAHGACSIALLAGDLITAKHYLESLLEHSTRHALPGWHVWARCYERVLDLKSGDVTIGLRLLRAGFDELGEARSATGYILLLGSLAEDLGDACQATEGLTAVDEVIARSEHTEERWAIAELLRIKGELVLLQGALGAVATAEDHFRQALNWAGRQGALAWELRAATSLARLLSDQGRSVDAIALLQPVYDQFTEGFDTPDLRTAKALLNALC